MQSISSNRLMVEVLEPRLLLSGLGDDHGDYWWNATALYPPDSDAGYIGDYGFDDDMFSFYAISGGTYNISVGFGTLGSIKLSLKSSNGYTTLRTDSSYYTGGSASIGWTASYSGTYYFNVESPFYNTGSYGVGITATFLPIDDHGDSASTATYINKNSWVNGNIETYGDNDFFYFYANSGYQYTIEASVGTLTDTYLWLYDTNGYTILDSDDDSGNGLASKIQWVAPTSGYRYINVEPSYLGSDYTGNYQLRVAERDPNPITIKGSFSYINNSDYLVKANAYVVELWEHNINTGDELVAFDAVWDGEYYFAEDLYGNSIANIDPENGTCRDLYVRILIDDPIARVSPNWITDYLGISYYYDTEVKWEVSGGTVDFGNTTVSGIDTDAFAIHDALSSSWAWLHGESGNDWTRSQVGVYWPTGDWPQFTYGYSSVPNLRSNAIWIPSDWPQVESAAKHEYGHAVHYEVRGGDLPLGDVPIGEEDPANGTENAGLGAHWLYSKSSPEFALTEGWAEFFQVASYYGSSYEYSWITEDFNLEYNWLWMGSDGYKNYIEGYGFYNEDGNTGDIVEGAVASIIWDIYDGGENDDDGIDEGFFNFWTIFENDMPDAIWDNDNNPRNDIYHAWIDRDFGYIDELNAIFIDHGIPVTDDQYDMADPNNTYATATNLGVLFDDNSWNSLIVVDEDWYSFSIDSVGTESDFIGIDFDGYKGDLALELWSDDPEPVVFGESDIWGDTENISLAGLASGNYYVRVYGYGGDYSPNYTLTINAPLFDRTPPLAPGTPDLHSSSDSGFSDTDNITNVTSPTFTWDAAIDPGDNPTGVSGYQWRVGGGDWSDWQINLGVTVDALSDGTHTFYVRAKDYAENIGTEAALEFVIDIIAPTVITASPLGQLDENFSYLDVTFSEPVDVPALSRVGVEVFGPEGLFYSDSFQPLTADSCRIRFPEQEAGGGYRITMGPEVIDLAGNPMEYRFEGEIILPVKVTLGGASGNTVSFRDADGSNVRVLSIGGQAVVMFAGTNLSETVIYGTPTVIGDNIEIKSIDTICQGNPGMLMITTFGGDGQADLGDINGESLSMIIAQNVNLWGDITMTGSLGMMMVGDISGGTTITTGQPGNGLMVIAGDVGADFDIAGPVNMFMCDSFSSGSLTADKIAMVMPRTGDLGADLTARNGDIGTVIASGAITGQLSASGNINMLMSQRGGLTGTVQAGNDIGILMVNGDVSGRVSAMGKINMLMAMGSDITGAVRAGTEIGILMADNLDNALLSAGSNIRMVNIRYDILDSYILGGYDVGTDCAFDIQESGGGDLLNNGNIGFVMAGGSFKRSYIGAGVLPSSTLTGSLPNVGIPATGVGGNIQLVIFGSIDTNAQDDYGMFYSMSRGSVLVGGRLVDDTLDDYFRVKMVS